MSALKGSPSPHLVQENKDKVLLVLSSVPRSESGKAPGGVSATSFIECFVLLANTNLQIVLATPKGLPPEFIYETDKCQQWVRSKPNLFYGLKSLEELNAADYLLTVVPNALGAVQDLSSPDSGCSRLISDFIKLNRPLCAIGFGVSALLGGVKVQKGTNGVSVLNGRSVTGPSNAETSRFDYFKLLAGQQVEDRLRDVGAKYTSAEGVDQIHVVIDGSLVTAQNGVSTGLAVQNVIWLWKLSQMARSSKANF